MKLNITTEARKKYILFYKQYPPTHNIEDANFFFLVENITERIKLIYGYHKEITNENTKQFLEAANYLLIDIGTNDKEKRYITS